MVFFSNLALRYRRLISNTLNQFPLKNDKCFALIIYNVSVKIPNCVDFH